MTAEEILSSLSAKYGAASNWYLPPFAQLNAALVVLTYMIGAEQ